MRTSCIFAHYDRDGIVDEYVLHYLKVLRQNVKQLIFVTTAGLDAQSVNMVRALDIEVIERANEGYDFYSYKVGIEQLSLDQYDSLMLCNDSVYGPFDDLAPLFERMGESECDFWGITESFDFARHLQSYFLVFKRPVLESASFRRFWESVEILGDKKDIIRCYEVGLTQLLIKAGYRYNSLTDLKDVGTFHRIWQARKEYLQTLGRRWRERVFWVEVLSVASGKMDVGVNHTHSDWRKLLEQCKVPFLKIELLRDNPRDAKDLDAVLNVIKSLGDYPVELILGHIARVCPERVAIIERDAR